ncbi:undecaprenyl-diphosphate phosphatase [Bacteroidales bacterium OttesenSCG-928-K03]|nr:undecaprenyl-diphosphate phosphatase [Odoribacter sp. OttesenSCG-928-L07]MDL2239007.1 undecaprenyl-diphosphate phosphatase [Bacteroidales bacterium OttesenSCG-928-L14]MDL2240705.1 undecaprenyl-diphosphate phosphatase [Bacteroidales bacterium OttesenSCG-928-K22]MDL2242155.1 undecaprenyl-diphosphate phosphatase [Bacteroidales bacterium OttesenSCG-928-K03]
MNWLEALILGIIQGLTEFLPISSSGHLELAKAMFGVEAESSLMFTVAVHAATVLSTIIVFRKDIGQLFVGFFSKGHTDEKSYVFKLLLSMIPVGIVALLSKDEISTLFNGNIIFVGSMLLVTALLLTFSYFRRNGTRSIGWLDSFIIGIAQAVAVIPGISRSGATIATGMIIGNKPTELAKFSFLMVIIPILGETFLDLVSGDLFSSSIGMIPIILGFVAAFVSGLFACKLMINIVKKGKLIWFALYCLIAGLTAIIIGII